MISYVLHAYDQMIMTSTVTVVDFTEIILNSEFKVAIMQPF